MKKFITIISSLLLTFSLATLTNAQLKYIDGKDYMKLPTPIDRVNKDGENPEVIEFFSFTCPHCRSLHPIMHKWETEDKQENIDFYQIPAFSGSWRLVGQAKLTAEKLGLGYDFDIAFFDAIHKDKKRYLLGDKDKIIQFIAEFSKKTPEEVKKSWDSLQVKKQIKFSEKLFNQGNLSSVPTIVVNGKYIANVRSANELAGLIDYLTQLP